MFTYTGLSKEEVAECRKESLFMLDSGRISVAGINDGNLGRVVDVIVKAIEKGEKNEKAVQVSELVENLSKNPHCGFFFA